MFFLLVQRLAALQTALIWLLWVAGCAGQPLVPTPLDSLKDRPSVGQHLGYHVAVPFFPDDTDQCGPATLASLLVFWEIPADPKTLKEEIYIARLKGSLPIDLLLAAQKRGLEAEIQRGELDLLKSELGRGHPLVAFLNLGLSLFPLGHYVVVTGYDDQRQGLYVHSAMDRDLFIPYERFLPSWEKTGRWVLVVSSSKQTAK
jgi:hypothetical protein